MYSSIHYAAGSTLENVMADIVKLLTGETSLANLSTDVDIPESDIYTGWSVAGWTTHDISDVSKPVLKAEIGDMPGVYKYIRFEISGTNYIKYKYYHDWDEVGHVGNEVIPYGYDKYIYSNGTDREYNSPTENTGHPAYRTVGNPSTSSSLLIITASPRHVGFMPMYNNVQSTVGFTGIFEHTRLTNWDTPANGIKPVVVSNRPWAIAYTSSAGSYTYRSWFTKYQTFSTQGGAMVYQDQNSNNSKILVQFPLFPSGTSDHTKGKFGESSTYTSSRDLFAGDEDTTNTMVARYGADEDDATTGYDTWTQGNFLEFGCQSVVSNQYYGGVISSLCNIHYTKSNLGNPNDIVQLGVDGQRYRLFGIQNGTNFLVVEG